MALPKLLFSFLFLLLLSSCLHVHARDGQFLSYQPITQQPPTSTTTGTTSNPSGDTFTNTNSNNKAYVTNSQGMSDTKFTDRGYTNPTGKSAADVPYRGESGDSNAKNNYKNDASVTGSQATEGRMLEDAPAMGIPPNETYQTAIPPKNTCYIYPC